MSDIISTGNKRDKWILRVTELLNWLNDNKSAVLTAGDNISLTPKSDGTIEISASGGGEGTVTDVLVDGVSVVNQDGEAEITMPSDFVGATSQQAGTQGLVPAPLVTEKDKFLKGDGTWGEAGGGNVDDVVMNGQSIVDANKIASFNNYVELTRAEWEALPDSKYSDGILYCIKDSGSEKANFFSPIIYSLAEREVGVWTDGKPLYQKTKIYTSGLTPSTSEQLLDNNIASNIDELFFVNSGSYVLLNTGRRFTNLAYYDGSNYQCNISVVGKNSYYVIKFGSDTISRIVLTYFYTKTTDNPGTGKWTPSGVPAHHYSTEEQVIGTWIDGKPLYEKTFEFTPANDTSNHVLDATLTKSAISPKHIIKGVYELGSLYGGDNFAGDDIFNSDNIRNRMRAFVNANGLCYNFESYTSSYPYLRATITIQYTKTTD